MWINGSDAISHFIALYCRCIIATIANFAISRLTFDI